MNIRKWLKVLHRDIGYLSVGLTIIYAVSGIAVNHIDQWNPNYIIKNENVTIRPFTDSTASNNTFVNYVQSELNIEDSLTSSFRLGPNRIQLFYNRKTIDADLSTGVVKIEKVTDRKILREANYLHLNNPKKAWTYIADIFAVGLIFLAVSGIFIINNKKNGLMGRGKYLIGIGVIIPIIFLILYF